MRLMPCVNTSPRRLRARLTTSRIWSLVPTAILGAWCCGERLLTLLRFRLARRHGHLGRHSPRLSRFELGGGSAIVFVGRGPRTTLGDPAPSSAQARRPSRIPVAHEPQPRGPTQRRSAPTLPRGCGSSGRPRPRTARFSPPRARAQAATRFLGKRPSPAGTAVARASAVARSPLLLEHSEVRDPRAHGSAR